jgi:alpha-1,6-mannosyltransferase
VYRPARPPRLFVIGTATLAMHVAISLLQQRIAFGALSVWPVALYVAATLVVFALYAKVLGLAARRVLTPVEKRQALIFPAVIGAALLLTPPVISFDVYSYLGHGYQARAGANPYAQPVKDIASSDAGRALIGRGWLPVHGVSPYGPLWTWVEVSIVETTSNLALQAAIVKTVAFAFSLAAAYLIWMILGNVAPRAQLAGTLVYLWNPVVVMEFAGEGHNESLIVAAALLALWLTVRAKPAAGALMLLIGALVKVSSLVVLPAQLVYGWRTVARRGRFVSDLMLAGACVGGLAAVLYAPWWFGVATFDGLLAHGRPSILPSTSGVLFWYLIGSHSPEASAQLISLLAGTAMIVVTVVVSLQVVDLRSLFRACALTSVAYLLIAPVYWPWYVTLPIAMLALTPSRSFVTIVMVFSVASRLASPLDRLRLNGLTGWHEIVIAMTVVGLWMPAVVFAVWAVRRNGSSWVRRLRRSRYVAALALERAAVRQTARDDAAR